MSLQDELRATRDAPVAGPRRRRRWDLVAFVVVLLGPAAGLALWAAARQRVGDLEERLVRDANAKFSASHPRPVHVGAPLPGTFGDAVARHLPRIQAAANALKGDEAAREVARAVVAGDRAPSELPAAYASALERLGPDLDGLLRGTRAERADLPIARDSGVPCDGADWTGYPLAALLAGVRARRALAAGDAGAAASSCLDGLALGRDAAITRGLVGHMVGLAIVTRLEPPCAEALAALDGPARESALASVRRIREAFPSVAETLRVDLLSAELIASAPVLPPAVRARLHPAALPLVREGERPTASWERLAIRDGWRGLRETWDGLLQAAGRTPAAARDEALASVYAGSRRRVNPMVYISTLAYGKYADRMDAVVLRLDALALAGAAAAYRERTGEWPASAAALATAGLLRPDEEERTSSAKLAPRGGGRALELKVPLPAIEQKDPREVVLRITLRARDHAKRAGAR